MKVSFSKNAGRGTWRAHGRYLSREGAQREGERGLGFDAERDDVSLPERLERWQRTGDARVWKIVVSPEAGARADLQGHTRRLLAQMEADLGTRLEWAAIDHHDTAHPHAHLVIRGLDEEGRTLLLSRDYVRSGIRARSQELLTRELGHRHERDQHLAREQSVDAPRVTEIDRSLLARADASGVVSFEDQLPIHPDAQARRLQDVQRLQFLEGLGLAERLGPRRWRLPSELIPGLRQIQLAGDVQKSLARSRALVTDSHAPLVLSRPAPGTEVSGRVASAGIDESRDEPFLILEGIEGRRHLVPQTREIAEARGTGRLRPGAIVTLRGTLGVQGGRATTRTEIVEHGRLRDLRRTTGASTLLDLEALRSVRQTGDLPGPAAGRGFFRQWRAAVRARAAILEREGFLVRARGPAAGRTYEVERGAERMVEGGMADRGRAPTSLEALAQAHRKEIAMAPPETGRTVQGVLVGYAVADDGLRYAVLDTGRALTAVPTDRRDLEEGHRVRARASEVGQDDEGRERRRLAWALDDLEHARDRGRGR